MRWPRRSAAKTPCRQTPEPWKCKMIYEYFFLFHFKEGFFTAKGVKNNFKICHWHISSQYWACSFSCNKTKQGSNLLHFHSFEKQYHPLLTLGPCTPRRRPWPPRPPPPPRPMPPPPPPWGPGTGPAAAPTWFCFVFALCLFFLSCLVTRTFYTCTASAAGSQTAFPSLKISAQETIQQQQGRKKRRKWFVWTNSMPLKRFLYLSKEQICIEFWKKTWKSHIFLWQTFLFRGYVWKRRNYVRGFLGTVSPSALTIYFEIIRVIPF